MLCGKDCCPEEIHNCDGYLYVKCKENGKSCINILNQNQIKYILSDISTDVFLKACPGSGKTEVLGMKCAYETKSWCKKSYGMAILTFTNSAEDEIRDRVVTYLNETVEYPHYLGTFTSWLHGYIANPFLSRVTGYEGNKDKDKSINLIEDGSDTDFLNIFASKYKYEELGNIKPQEFYRDLKTDEFIYCGNRNRDGKKILAQLIAQDKWRKNDLDKVKKRFWKKGFCLYDDVEYLVLMLLSEHEEIANYLANRFPVILVDECQDLSYVQLEILRLLHDQGCKLHFIGDLDQAIYGFRRIEPSDTKDFVKELLFREMELNQNYRSCQEIVDISDYIINRNSSIEGCEEKLIDNPLLVILYKKDKEREAVEIFHALVIKSKLLVQNSRIIVRNNSLKNRLFGLKQEERTSNVLEDIGKALFLFKEGKSITEFKNGFKLICRGIQKIYFDGEEHLNSNYFYMPKELEKKDWRELITTVKNILLNQIILLNFKISWSSWKKNLESILENKVSPLPLLEGREIHLGRIRSGNANKTLEEVLLLNQNCRFKYKIETIHGCKGMSLDAVLFMSSYQAGKRENESGSYWRQWFDTAVVQEKNRLAYVAFSRAKYLLALGIPKSSTFTNDDKKKLENCGFKIIEV